MIAGLGRPVVFGFFQLDNEVVSKAEEVLEELQRNLTQKMLPDLPLLHGLVFRFFSSKNFLNDQPGFALNTLGVMEKDSVVHLAIQVSTLP